MLPLSLAVVGLLLVALPAFTAAVPYVRVGTVLAVTLTVRLAVRVPLLPSVTVRTTVLEPTVALHPAATFAVMVPLLLEIELMVMPVGTVVAVTIRLAAAVS